MEFHHLFTNIHTYNNGLKIDLKKMSEQQQPPRELTWP